jgi:selenocysteine lyase/cysteine desulfurase
VDAVHYAPHGPIDVAAMGADVLICSPYKFFGPHLGLFFGRQGVIERWRPYKVRPADDEPVGHRFETGTLSHEALAGTTAAVDYIESLGWEAIRAHEREVGQSFLEGLPGAYRLHGLPTMEGRVPTFSITHPERSPDDLAAALGERGIATWPGNFYAVEVMKRLGLPDGTLRIGFVHYNSDDEVDRVLEALNDLA